MRYFTVSAPSGSARLKVNCGWVVVVNPPETNPPRDVGAVGLVLKESIVANLIFVFALSFSVHTAYMPFVDAAKPPKLGSGIVKSWVTTAPVV
jgi:hypothetical protein